MIIHFAAIKLINAQTTYIKSDLSESGSIIFAKDGINSYVSSVDEFETKITTFSQKFDQTPSVLIGLTFFDYGTNQYRTAFKFEISDINTSQVSIKLDKFGQTSIFGIGINYIAIQDADIRIYNLQLNYASNADIILHNNEIHNFVLTSNVGKTIGVKCYLTGFDCQYMTPPKSDANYSSRNLSVQTTIDNSNTFYTITISANDLATSIKIVYLNCIEYYNQSASDYSMINNLKIFSDTDIFPSDTITRSINLDSTYTGSNISYFLGISSMDNYIKVDAVRIQYLNFIYSSQQFQMSLITWSNSKINSVSATFFQYQMIDCKSSQQLINSYFKKQCVTTCDEAQFVMNYQSTQSCRSCTTGCKQCNSKSACQVCYPGYFLDSNLTCGVCNSNCLECLTSATNCVSCPTSKFLYANACYDTQPDGTYCDQMNICSACKNNCKLCDATLALCQSCFDGYYFYQQQCSLVQPSNTYCATKVTCQQCTNPNCENCSFGLEQCTLCKSNWYFFQYDQDCYISTPPNSYCQSNNCILCISSCMTCNISLTTCLTCYNNQYLFNGQCQVSQPPSSYCDANRKCQTCLSPNCSGCDSTLNNCLNCTNGYFLYHQQCQTNCSPLDQYFLDGSCTVLQPANTNCNTYKVCVLCPSSCNGCTATQMCTKCSNPNDYWYFGKCFATQPDSTYCVQNSTLGIQLYCQSCHPSCSQCADSTFDKCTQCQSGYVLQNNTSCVCQLARTGYNSQTQLCEKCQVNGCIQCLENVSICTQCDYFLQLDVSNSCTCKNLNQYYSAYTNSCITNTINFCKVSTKFDNKCLQCNDGYFNFNQQMCSYCGKSTYTNDLNQCVLPCAKGCLICTNATDCILRESDANNSNGGGGSTLPFDSNDSSLCNFSCGLCNGNLSNNCLTCSSATRIYQMTDQTCMCKSNYSENNTRDCIEMLDVKELFYVIQLAAFVIFLVTSLPFIPFDKFYKINYNFNVVQLIALLSYDSILKPQLNYSRILTLTQYVGIVTIIPGKFIGNESSIISSQVNQVLLLSFFQGTSLILHGIQAVLQKQFLFYFNEQMLALSNRLTSTLNISLILNLFIQHSHEIDNTIFIALIVASTIQLITTILKFKHIYFHIFSQSNSNQSNSNLNLTRSQTIVSSSSLPSFQNDEKSIAIVESAFEIRRILNGLSLAYLKQSILSYQIISFLGIIGIVILLYLKPYQSSKTNLEIILIELFTSTCFLLFSFLKNDLTNSNTASSCYYFLLSLVITVILIEITSLLSSANQIASIIYQKIKNISNKSSNSYNAKELVPQMLEKEQIDNILSSRKWDFEMFSSKQSKPFRVSLLSKK